MIGIYGSHTYFIRFRKHPVSIQSTKSLDMEKQIVVTPMKVDGLLVEKDQFFVEASGRYDNLPSLRNGLDFNPDTPNVGHSVRSQAFEDSNLQLRKGMHLHWQLPRAFFTAGANTEAKDGHAIPNRWFIQKEYKGCKTQWMVESDYLHPAGKPNMYNSVVFPINITGHSDAQPFRFLGRQLHADGWLEDQKADRLEKLTTMGYGEPSFASFYPNCSSVLGFYDEAVNQSNQLASLTYQVLGWYSKGSQDPIRTLLKNNDGNKGFGQQIKDQLEWQIDDDTHADLQGIVCWGELVFEPEPSLDIENPHKNGALEVSLGNSGSEALSALVGQALHSEACWIPEDQLENLHLKSAMDGNVLDVRPRFRRLRHANTFNRIKGENQWRINTQKVGAHVNLVIDLPENLLDDLADLNHYLQALDEAQHRLAWWQGTAFADWYKYMICTYPPEDLSGEFPDEDDVLSFIQTRDLAGIGENKLALEKVGQEQLQPILTGIHTKLAQINLGRVTPDKTWFQFDFPAQGKYPACLKMNRVAWEKNTPFSKGCLLVNSESQLSIQLAETTKALSTWIWLARQQEDQSVFLSTDEEKLISTDGVSSFWEVFQINGVDMPASEKLVWSDLPKEEWVHLYFAWKQPLKKNSVLHIMGASGKSGMDGKLASLGLYKDTLDSVEQCASFNHFQHLKFELQQGVAEPYYVPKEPAIALQGPAAKTGLRNDPDLWLDDQGALPCLVITGDYPTTVETLKETLQTIEQQHISDTGKAVVGRSVWKYQPWHPIMMDWEVAFRPASDHLRWVGHFNEDFLNSHFYLPTDQFEVQPSEKVEIAQSAALYRGRAHLSPHSKKVLINKITYYLKHLKLADCIDIRTNPCTQDDKARYMKDLGDWWDKKEQDSEDWETFKAWYEGKHVFKNGNTVDFKDLDASEQAQDFNYTLIRSLLDIKEKQVLTQSLSGFNAALLTLHQTHELPISDPLGFQYYQDFTKVVAEQAKGGTLLSPLLYDHFLPLRAGLLQLHRLRLIDSFGQYRSIKLSKPTVATPLKASDTPYEQADQGWLSPRLLQPAKMRFRWLDADTGQVSMGNSPICGWLLLNELDGSLEVFDQVGNALGLLDQNGKWRGFPGMVRPVPIEDFSNPYLARTLSWIQQQDKQSSAESNGASFMAKLSRILLDALEKIAPESYVHHDELAMILGKPLALIRTSVDIKLQQPPAIDHSWSAFHLDLLRDKRDTAGIENLQVPVRLGDPEQFNDGLAAFWVEEEGMLGKDIYPSGHPVLSKISAMNVSDESNINGFESEGTKATDVTMLIDPSGLLHATPGILPASQLSLDKNAYQEALRQISMTLRAAPLLMPSTHTTVPLPDEAGYEWTWLQRSGTNWDTSHEHGLLAFSAVQQSFNDPAAIWKQLLDQGWIKELKAEKALIQPISQRKSQNLDPHFKALQPQIETFLDQRMIIPMPTEAQFDGPTRIVEGWLNLKKTQPSPTTKNMSHGHF